MCRIFLSINHSDNNSLIEKFIEQAHPGHKPNTPHLPKNSRDNGPHTDGTGFAVLSNANAHRWVIYKSVDNAIPDGFRPKNITIGHIRKKCPNYPGDISLQNTHPFSYRNYIMVHNGFLHDIDTHPTKYKGWVAQDLQKHIKGETDSEIFFYIYLTFLRKHRSHNRKNGFYLIDTLREVLAKFIEEGDEVSANLVLSDGSFILVTRYLWVDPKKHRKRQHALSLYCDVCDGIVISSEPLTPDYKVIPENTALLIDIKAETMYSVFI